MKLSSSHRGVAFVAAVLASCAAHAASGPGTPELAKPKLKAMSSAKPSYKLDEPLALTVQFEGKQCVFNIEFKAADGSVKTQGFFFNDPNQLTWAVANAAAYWGIGAGSYTVSAVPHANPKVAGANGIGCAGGAVSTELKIEAPIAILPAALPATKSGADKPGEKQGAVDMFKPGEKQGAPIFMKPAAKADPPGSVTGKTAPAGK